MKKILKRKSKNEPKSVIEGQVVHYIDHKNTKKYHYVTLGTSLISFAVIGSFLVFGSFAAVRLYATFESESGTRAGNTTIVTDATATSGSALRFDSPVSATCPAGQTGTPPNCVTAPTGQCANGGAYLWSNLEACGWPGPANTGPRISQCPGGQLTLNSGATNRKITISTPNTTISCQNITGCLNITAANVKVIDVQITCTSGKTGTNANGTAVIFVENGASATIDHTLINGMNGVHSCVWHQGTSLEVNAVNCYGINDGIFSWSSAGQTYGDNFNIHDSYFHDFTSKTANGHIDGYQTEGAGNGVINHNTFYMSYDGNGMDSAIAIWNSNRSSHDITVQNNLIAGGGFSIYAEDYDPSEASPAGGYSVTNIFFTNNRFSTKLEGGCVGIYGVWYTRGAPSDQWRRSGNTVLETGENIDNGNPHSGGHLCT